MNSENFANYEPELWNCKPAQQSANCYQYMLNELDEKRINDCYKTLKNTNKKDCGQIGLGCPDDDCNDIENQCERYKYIVKNNRFNRDIKILDNFYEQCPSGYYKGAIFFAPLENQNDGYHFMRQDNDGFWSHKYSYGEATDRDLQNEKISDPNYAYLDYNYDPDKWWNFNKLCGTFCIKEKDNDENLKIKLKNHDSNFCKAI